MHDTAPLRACHADCDGNMYLPILHLPRVELRCKLQEKLHHMTGLLAVSGNEIEQKSNVDPK